MIISASRRTDIPAFYSDWMTNRIEAGYCTVFNPFNRDQITYVSLKPEDVDVIVFWTKNSKPFRSKIKKLDERGLRYYFQYTLTQYSKELETRVPNFEPLKAEFLALAEQVGPERIIWRYDPIIISKEYSFERHIDLFGSIAREMKGVTHRVVISLVDYYQKTLRNMSATSQAGSVYDQHPEEKESFAKFMKTLVKLSQENGLEIQSCAEAIELKEYGIEHGKCVDDAYILRVFGLDVIHKKDPGQRKECGCVKSIDIGVYDTCLHGCQFCYATKNHNTAKLHFDEHDPKSPSLIGWFDAQPKKTKKSTDQISFDLQ